VTAVFSPHGDRIVTTSFDNTARIFNAATAELTAVLRGHAGRLTGGVFSGDGRWVATSGNDGTARISGSFSGTARAASPFPCFGHSGEIASTRSLCALIRIKRPLS
jgi:WD40 repeat protein